MAETTSGATATRHTPTAGVNKMEAVRRALGELGKGAMPLQIQAFVRERFGHEMTLDHISNYKSDILRRAARAKRTAPKAAAAQAAVAPKPAPPPPVKSAPPPRPNGKALGGIALADVQALKGLVGRVGAANLKSLIDVLSK